MHIYTNWCKSIGFIEPLPTKTNVKKLLPFLKMEKLSK